MTQRADGANRWTMAERLLAVMTALLTLTTAFLAYKTATITQDKNQTQAVADDINAELASLQSLYDTVKRQKETIQAENASLREQLGLGESGGPTDGDRPIGGEALGTPLLGDQSPDDTLVTQSHCTYFDDTMVSINGRKANRALGAVGSCAESYIVLNLGRKYSTLKARLGVTDKSKSTEQMEIEIIAIDGGRQLSKYKKSFRVGESDDIELLVSNVLHLRFVFRGPPSQAQVYAGVGDPTVFP